MDNKFIINDKNLQDFFNQDKLNKELKNNKNLLNKKINFYTENNHNIKKYKNMKNNLFLISNIKNK